MVDKSGQLARKAARVSIAGPDTVVMVIRGSVAIAPVWRVVRHRHSRVSSPDRSFAEPSNTALQPSRGAVTHTGTLARPLASTTRRRNTDGAHARTASGAARG